MEGLSALNTFLRLEGEELRALYDKKGQDIFIADIQLIKSIIKKRPDEGHKNIFGHSLIIAGSDQMPGAAILTCMAALSAGCGLVTGYLPPIAIAPLLTNLPEAMVINRSEISFSDLDLYKYDAVAFGPGMGMSEESNELLNKVLSTYTGNIVIDADGLNLIASDMGLIKAVEGKGILTPHAGEFDRLFSPHTSMIKRIYTQTEFTGKHDIVLLLKGHHSSISVRDKLIFNSTGNNGMATAGSGDVLTGIITSLCAQGYSREDAAILGCYIHGYAGDVAARKYSKHALKAGHIIEGLSDFFKSFE